MWPWEHLVFGYVQYSALSHAYQGRSPDDISVLLVAIATQLPDFIDKPLAWKLDVLLHGRSLAHSLVFTAGFLGVVSLVTLAVGSRKHAIAITVGYISHLLGDVMYNLFTGGDISFRFLLWPFIRRLHEPTVSGAGELLAIFSTFLATPTGRIYLLVEGCVLIIIFALWVYDGCPGLFYRSWI